MKVIYGLAGTGKSTYMASLIRSEKRSFVVLAATHSAVENIYRIVNTMPRNRFMTIYSYFRIDYVNNIVRGPPPKTIVDVIYIDEFSLINKYLFKSCISKVPDSEIIMCGDPLQLNAVYDTEEGITFTELKKLDGMSANAIEHYHLGIFGVSDVQKAERHKLTEIRRSDDYVKKVFTAIFVDNDKSFDGFKFISFNDVVQNVYSNDYVVLASKYSKLQEIYDELKCIDKRYKVVIKQMSEKGFRKLYLYEGMELMITETNEYYYNGQHVYFVDVLENGKSIYVKTLEGEVMRITRVDDVLPVVPVNLLSIHKSQGMTISKVIIYVEDLFDVSMLYTAITRAKEDVMFYVKGDKKVDVLFENAHVDTFNELKNKFYSV